MSYKARTVYQLMQVYPDGKSEAVYERPGVPLEPFKMKKEADIWAIANAEKITTPNKATMTNTLLVLELIPVPEATPKEE